MRVPLDSLVAGQRRHLELPVVAAYVERLAARVAHAGAVLYGPMVIAGGERPPASDAPLTQRVCWHVQDDLDRGNAVFLPVRWEPTRDERRWCLGVLVGGGAGRDRGGPRVRVDPRAPPADDLAHGTVYLVDSVPGTEREHEELAEHLVAGIRGRWSARSLPCQPLLRDRSVSGIRMLHHLHVLVQARFWEDPAAWLERGRSVLCDPVDGPAERAHVRRWLQPTPSEGSVLG